MIIACIGIPLNPPLGGVSIPLKDRKTSDFQSSMIKKRFSRRRMLISYIQEVALYIPSAFSEEERLAKAISVLDQVRRDGVGIIAFQEGKEYLAILNKARQVLRDDYGYTSLTPLNTDSPLTHCRALKKSS